MGKKPQLTPEEHRYQRLKRVVSSLHNPQDLDEVLALLSEGKVSCASHLLSYPPVVGQLISKAGILIVADSFVPVLKDLLPLYAETEYITVLQKRRSVLEVLCQQIEKLIDFPEKVIQIIEIFIDFEKADNLTNILSCLYEQVAIEPSLSYEIPVILQIEKILVAKGAITVEARSHCLRRLPINSLIWERQDVLKKITGTTSMSMHMFGKRKKRLAWTVEFANSLTKMIERGADPSWAPNSPGYEEEVNASSLYVFLMGIDKIISSLKSEAIFPDLFKLLDLMMTDRAVNTKKDLGGRTLLHMLVGKHWSHSELEKKLKTQMYVKLVSKFLQHTNTLNMLDMVNNLGHTPLHSFLFTVLDGCAEHHDPVILQFASSILTLLKSSTNIDLQDEDGDTPLHEVMKYITFESSVFCEFCTIAKSITTSMNVEVQNKKQQTALLVLVERMYTCELLTEEFRDAVIILLNVLVTSTNVNKLDVNLMSPLSFILLAKETNSEDHTQEAFLKELEELFVGKGANKQVAHQGLRRKRGQDITDILKIIRQNGKIDEDLLERVVQLKESGYPECMDSTKVTPLCTVCRIFMKVKDRSQIDLFENFITTLLWVGNVQEIWRTFMEGISEVRNSYLLTSVQRVLMSCLNMGIKPTKEELVQKTAAIDGNRSSKMHLTVLNLLLEAFRIHNTNDVIPVRLDILSDNYLIAADYRKIATSLVRHAYQTLENCMASRSVVNILLFLAEGICDGDNCEEISSCFQELETMITDNWLRRSVLHLIVMVCNDNKLFNCIPQELIDKFLHITDLHGCTPLHLAYLCGNDASVDFLLTKGAAETVMDCYGVTPKELGLRVGVTDSGGQLKTVPSQFQDDNGETQTEHVDVVYQINCREVLETQSNVYELMKPMLVLPEEDRLLQSNDVKRLFERLVELMPDLLTGEIVVAGSSREKLKAGRLDEVDVQLRFHVFSSCLRKIRLKFWFCSETLDEDCFGEWLHTCLLQNLPYVDWQDIPLRLISVSHPWYFIYERPGPTQYVHMSVDVVPIIRVLDDSIVKYPLLTKQHEMLRRQFLILNRSVVHKRMWFLRWGNFSRDHSFHPTYCEYEWDILDSMATGPRLGVLIVKALLEISYASEGGKLASAGKPITSYMLKTVLFWLLSDEKALKNPLDVIEDYNNLKKPWQPHQNVLVSDGKRADEAEITESESRDIHSGNEGPMTTEEELASYKGQEVRPKEPDGGTRREEIPGNLNEQNEQVPAEQTERVVTVVNEEQDPKTTTTREDESEHLSIRVPSWMNTDDLEDYAEEGRTWGVNILQTILDLTDKVGVKRQEGQLLPFFEIRYDTFLLTYDNKDSIAELCTTLLGRLTPHVFYNGNV